MAKTETATDKAPEIDPIAIKEERIRVRAFQIYEARKCERDHALDHWLQAESELKDAA
jgi:hypothetical protein